MSRPDWDPRVLPNLEGRTYLVTGANAGLGYFTCEQLASAGASVIMTGRNPNRLAAARSALRSRVPGAKTETILLDTSNRGSVRAASASIRSRRRIDGLVLNAGIVHPAKRRTMTRDGNELVLATNLLGHFALAGDLLPNLAAARGRMVWLGSVSTSMWRFDPVDPQLRVGYSAWRAYVQSKVGTTAVALEADRRLRDAGVPVQSLVAHPGYALGGRTRSIPGVNEPSARKRFLANLQTPLTQSKESGAYPIVRAVADPELAGGQMVGPRWVMCGDPRRARPAAITRDVAVRERVWVECENATRVRWPFDAARRAAR